jgi:hypothetical protein
VPQKFFEARYQWFMPIILVTWKTEIGKTMVQSLPGQKVCKTPPQPIAEHGSMHLSSQTTRGAKIGRFAVPREPKQKSSKDPISKEKAECGDTCLLPQLQQEA